jgi:hypothetical protein
MYPFRGLVTKRATGSWISAGEVDSQGQCSRTDIGNGHVLWQVKAGGKYPHIYTTHR